MQPYRSSVPDTSVLLEKFCPQYTHPQMLSNIHHSAPKVVSIQKFCPLNTPPGVLSFQNPGSRCPPPPYTALQKVSSSRVLSTVHTYKFCPCIHHPEVFYNTPFLKCYPPRTSVTLYTPPEVLSLQNPGFRKSVPSTHTSKKSLLPEVLSTLPQPPTPRSYVSLNAYTTVLFLQMLCSA